MPPLIYAIAAPMLGALLCAGLGRRRPSWAQPVALAAGLASLGIILRHAPAVMAGQILIFPIPWVEAIGLRASWVFDGLALTFSLIISGIGVLILLYARRYMNPGEPLGFFYFSFLLFMGSMLGVVCSDHLLALLLFWELTSVSSFLLIGFWSHKPAARAGAFKALFITSGGGLALMMSFLLIGKVAGTFELSELMTRRAVFAGHPATAWILTGLLLGIFTKSAQWPFHIWLPHAMEAPTPVSAYLHAATMVKAGIFLLGRFFPIFGGEPLWTAPVTAIGLLTLLWASYQALKQHDLKAILAYSTVSQLGLLASLYGAGAWIGVEANTFHILTHACYKGSLFLLVGIIDHTAGERDIRKLGGLYDVIPASGILMALAALSMSGIPPFMGFISKEVVLESGLHLGASRGLLWIHPAAVALSAMLTVAYSLKIVHGVFWGRPLPSDLKRLHRPPLSMKFSPGVLAVCGLSFGLWPDALTPLVGAPLLGLPSLGAPRLAVWHGFSPVLLISAAVVAAGLYLYRRRHDVDRWQHARSAPVTFHQAYEAAMEKIVAGSQRLTRWTLPETTASAMGLLFACLLAAAWTGWEFTGGIPLPAFAGPAATPLHGSVAVFTIVCLAGLIAIHERIVKVILLGVIGFLVTFLFVLQGAPDLALTQFLVESIMLVLFILALKRIPETLKPWRGGWAGSASGALAAVAGLGFGAITYQMLRHPPAESVARYFIENAKTLAGGANIVNVILVDFRGYDTLGEISVVAMAALGVYSLLKGRAKT